MIKKRVYVLEYKIQINFYSLGDPKYEDRIEYYSRGERDNFIKEYFRCMDKIYISEVKTYYAELDEINVDNIVNSFNGGGVQSMKIYRVEHKDTKSGMWYNFDGSYNGIINKLTEGKSKQLPMVRDKNHNKDDKKWFSAVKSLDQLFEWFSELDLMELNNLGYELYEIKCNDYLVNSNEILFTRESVIYQNKLNLKIIKNYI